MKDFEANLKKLEKIIEQLNSGALSLNDSIELYKKGLDITKQAYQQLETTEKEVKLLIEKNGKIHEKNFSNKE